MNSFNQLVHPDLVPVAKRLIKKPRLLDLFCCEGLGADGYAAAGFEVVGVDIEPQPNYPYEFHRADALTFPLHGFDAIHASPPCQAHTTMSNKHRGKGTAADDHLDYIAAMRFRLVTNGAPWILENVHGAKKHLQNPITLYGGSFGLRVHRPRFFESNIPLVALPRKRAENPIGIYGRHHDGRLLWRNRDGFELRCARSVDEAREAMGVGERPVTWRGLTEGIPPAYTEFLGAQLLRALEIAA